MSAAKPPPQDSEGQKVLALFLATVTVVGLIVLVGGRALSVAGGVEGELITQLKELEGRGLTVALDGGVLQSTRLGYQRLHVSLEQPQRPVVVGTLDFVGALKTDWRRTQVSSVGLERVPFVEEGGALKPAAGWAPRLTALVQLLEARRLAIEAGAPWPTEDPADVALWEQMTERRYEVSGWFIRSEREALDVAEDYRLTGQTKDRPIDVKRTKRLRIVERADGTFGYEAPHE